MKCSVDSCTGTVKYAGSKNNSLNIGNLFYLTTRKLKIASKRKEIETELHVSKYSEICIFIIKYARNKH